MKRSGRRFRPIPVLLVLALGAAGVSRPQGLGDEVTDRLRARLERAQGEQAVPMSVGEIHTVMAMSVFYERRLFRPAWSGPHRPLAIADRLRELLRQAGDDGLRPDDYHATEIRQLVERIDHGESSPDILTDLDLLLTDAFLLYGAHMVSGRLNPETFDPEWIAVRREVDLVALLERALEERRPAEALRTLAPSQEGYSRLREALARYRAFDAAGGWDPIPEGPGLGRETKDRPPATPERLQALRARLRLTGDLEPAAETPDPPAFDEALEEAVRRFQMRHGLDPDGVAGAKTLAALNVSAADRARQIELNLERWRWLPRDLGRRYILVNVPDFTLRVVEDERTVLEMRVVVGRSYRRTPVFSDVIRYLVLNPYWEVPLKLAVEDKLPEIRGNPEYFAKMGIRVYHGWGSERDEIDPKTIDWSLLGKGNFPYRLRQDPGPLNALGQVKFMFPNKFNVYLHDTPSRELFRKAERALSSGCIRVEKPLELAQYLLGWDAERLTQALAAGADRTVTLPEPVPVHFEYWTAWVDAEGVVHFRTDIYDRDARLDAALAS